MFLSPKQNSYVCTPSRGQLHPSTFLHSLISLVILVAYVIIYILVAYVIIFISATNEQLFTFDRGQLLVPSSPREFPPGKNISGKNSGKMGAFLGGHWYHFLWIPLVGNIANSYKMDGWIPWKES